MRLQAAHVLADQQRGFDQLPQFPVRERRNPAVAVWVLEPEVVRIVAGLADL
jgi:hypothetical protein